jgi:signal transduction histidine kinase/CheY-like chemotaxis protein
MLCSPQKSSASDAVLDQLLVESVAVFTDPTAAGVNVNPARHIIHDVGGRNLCRSTSSSIAFYAAVPILGACGQLLGCYCVTDKHIRHDLSAEETYTVLTDIACAITHYLEQLHNVRDNERGRCGDESPTLNDTSPSSAESSEVSLYSGSSCDDTTPLTTPIEAPEFTFDLQMPTKPDPSRCTTASTNFHRPSTDPTANPTATVVEAIKSDFVSSLSHELRSPLHGCLAAAELLRETTLDVTQTDLVTMVQACSSTLLYTLNHVLDFSKVNDHEAVKSGHRRDSDISAARASQNIFGQTSEDYLCRLTQDVIEGMHFGHTTQQAAYSRALNTSMSDHNESHLDPAMILDEATNSTSPGYLQTTDGVAVFLHMESSAAWFSMICAGAWKRLVMNLFGNSLKFCSAGHIEVTLKMIPDPKNSQKRLAHLMVNDTGIGISEHFSKHGIFQPFVQENSLVNGTGLGLHIVKRIVDDMQGTISVQSVLGSGTRFDVTIPMVEPETPRSEVPLDGGQILDPSRLLRTRTICLLSPAQDSSGHVDRQRTSLVHSYVRRIAEEWYHMKVIDADMPAKVNADVYIAEASDFVHHARSSNQSSRVSLQQHRTILVGTPSQLVRVAHESFENVVRLGYPLGPRALVRALYAALERPKFVDQPTTSSGINKIISDYLSTNHIGPPSKDLPTAKGETNLTDITGRHLLLVDDNAINLKLLSTFVKKLGLDAQTAVDGQDALTKYKTWATKKHRPFTTILMDISMPKMNGFESSRAIRDFEAENNIPPVKIIALTALSSEASRREAKACGIDDFQMKPVSLKTLKGLFPEVA